MKADLYTRIVLTAIALCLACIAIRVLPIIPQAKAADASAAAIVRIEHTQCQGQAKAAAPGSSSFDIQFTCGLY